MKDSKSYREGFNKAAKLMGVDPDVLIKKAGPLQSVGKLGKRYLQLLAGGKPLTKYHKLMKSYGPNGIRHMGAEEGALRFSKRKLRDIIGAYKGELGDYTAKELQKVLAARLGTAGAVGTGLAGLMSNTDKKEASAMNKKAGISLAEINKAVKLLKKPYAWGDTFNKGGPIPMTIAKDMGLAGLGGGAVTGTGASLLSKLMGGESNTNAVVGAGVGAASGALGTSKFLGPLKKVRNRKLRALATMLAMAGGTGSGAVAGGALGKVVG